jgi:hypothetical protein
MYGDSGGTAAFGAVQWVLIGVFVVSVGVTAGLSTLGLSPRTSGAVFLVSFIGLVVLSWPVIERVYPRHDR